MFDILIVFEKKVYFEKKKSADYKKHEKHSTIYLDLSGLNGQAVADPEEVQGFA